MAWYLNRALTRFRAAVNAAYPRRDKTSDGTVGDAAHQGTNSDHNPDRDGSVDAWDMDVNLRSGNDAAAIEEMKRVFQAHPSSNYWIHNRQIASRSNGWRRQRYTGSNAHTMHVHWNTRESHEDSTAPWSIGEFMATLSEAEKAELFTILRRLDRPVTFSDGSVRRSDISIAEAASGVMHGKTIGGGSIYLAQQFAQLRVLVEAILAAVTDVAAKESILADLGALNAAAERVDDSTVGRITNPAASDEEVAAAVRGLLEGRPGVLKLLNEA